MPSPTVITYQLATAAVADGIATAQAVAAAGNLTLNGSLVSSGVAALTTAATTPGGSFSGARRVLITSTGADDTVVFTVYGTNRDNQPIIDYVTGVTNIDSQYTALDFKTVTRIAASAACAGNIAAGTNDVGSSPWVVNNIYVSSWALAVAVSPSATNTPTVNIEHTYDDVNGTALAVGSPVGQNWSVGPGSIAVPTVFFKLLNLVVATEATYADQPVWAHRVTITAGTGSVTLWSIQNGIAST